MNISATQQSVFRNRSGAPAPLFFEMRKNEGYGLQPVHNGPKEGWALAPEGLGCVRHER